MRVEDDLGAHAVETWRELHCLHPTHVDPSVAHRIALLKPMPDTQLDDDRGTALAPGAVD